MWITHSLCSYVWKRQRQRKESCITAPEPLKHRPDSHKHYSTTPHLSQRFQCSAAVQRSEIQTRSLKDQFSNSHVLRGKTENPVGASQKLFRRLMISFVCAAELLSVCARYIRIINNLNTFYWLAFCSGVKFISWWRIHEERWQQGFHIFLIYTDRANTKTDTPQFNSCVMCIH